MRKAKEGTLIIKDIRPTVFFIGDEGNLKHGIDILIENETDITRVNIEIRFGLKKENVDIEKIEKGRKSYRIYIPETKEKVDVEFILSAEGKVQDKRGVKLEPQRHWNVYLVHLSHHDIGYTGLPTDVLREHDGYMDDILRFCEETEDWPFDSKFKYTVEQSWSVMHFIENRPRKVVDRLIHFIKKGQIEISAFFGNQVSQLCGHEELIRLMYPSFRLKQKYDIPIRSAASDDMAGLSWGLAKVLAGADVRYFAPALADWGECVVKTFCSIFPRNLPGTFLWEAPDGAQILLWYGGGDMGAAGFSWWDYEQALHQLPKKLNSLDERGYPLDIIRYRFRGGERDNSPPGLRLSYIVREWNKRWVYPKLIVATNPDFFKCLDEKYRHDFRVFRGELPDTDNPVGALSTAKETGINRITHELLHSAEKFATIATSTSEYPYPASSLREAYDNMLLYDEHTWGFWHPIGPAQEAEWNEKGGFAYRAAALSQNVLSKGLNKIVDEVERPDDGYHVVVFNSLSWERTDVVRVEFKPPSPCGRPMHTEQRAQNLDQSVVTSGSAIGRWIVGLPINITEGPFELLDIQTGERVPYQIVRLDSPQAPVPYAAYRYALGHGIDYFTHFFELVFVAKDVPSMGYKTYRIVPSAKVVNRAADIEVKEASLENRFFKVILDPETGAIESIYDKELEREFIDEEAPHKLNQLIIRSVKSGKKEKNGTSIISKGETGPIYGSLVVSGSAFGCPQITSEVILYDNIKRVDIANRVLKDSTPLLEVYFAFPFKIEPPTFHFEGCNSVIQPIEDQLPDSNTDYYAVQHWADVTDGSVGVALSSIEAPTIEFGGLWEDCISKAHRGIPPSGVWHDFLKAGDLKKGYMYSYVMANNFRTNFQPVQIGERLFRYSITTHKGDWKKGKACNFGWAFQNPLIPVCIDGKKKGMLPTSYSHCQIDKPNVLVLTLKKAEDDNGLIIRVMETEGKDTAVTVRVPFISIVEAYETNLVEENRRSLSAQEHELSLRIKAFGITTVRLMGHRT